jgi:hypothetical protein
MGLGGAYCQMFFPKAFGPRLLVMHPYSNLLQKLQRLTAKGLFLVN